MDRQSWLQKNDIRMLINVQCSLVRAILFAAEMDLVFVASDVYTCACRPILILFVTFACLCLFLLFLFISVCYRQGE